MRLKTAFVLLISALLASTAFAQIHVQKLPFVNFNANSGALVPQIAQNPDTGESLVVWLGSNDSGNLVRGRFIDQNGRPKTAPITLASGYWLFDLALAFNPIRHEYLVVWDDRPTDGDRYIIGLRLNSAGKPIGSQFFIYKPSPSPLANWCPRVIFNPVTGGYAIVWENRPNNSALGFQLLAASLSDTGKVNGPVLVIKKAQGDFESHTALGCTPMDIVYHSPSGKLLVAYFAVRSDHKEDYWLAALDPQLKTVAASASLKLNKEPILNTYPWDAPPYEGASIATHDNTAVVFFVDNNSLKRREISLQGKPAGEVLPAMNMDGLEFYDPKAIFSSTPAGTQGLLVATKWEETGENSVWGQSLDSNGLPVGTPAKLYTQPAGSAAEGPALTTLPNKTTNPVHPFVWLGAMAQPSGNGIVELKLTLPQ